jgi:pyruvate dehydrogenase E1 component
MLPFYIYYSMFGFQRVGDAIWAAADQRARGFLLGATSGRTTLGGEGLQHQDGSSHLVAATIPNCKAYDPAFAGELAVILDAGMREMVEQQADVFYYVTLMNENYAQPDLPAGVEADVLRGAYRFGTYGPGVKGVQAALDVSELTLQHSEAERRVTLLGSGAILTEVIQAAEQLAAQGVGVEVLSITSWSELARDGMAAEHLADAGRAAGAGLGAGGLGAAGAAGAVGAGAVGGPCSGHLANLLSTTHGPVIAATDYVRAVPESVRAFVPEGRRYTTLGTDGFGRSDTRAALRRFFSVDANSIAQAALLALAL